MILLNKFKKALGAFGLSMLFILTGCADKGTLGKSTVEDSTDSSGSPNTASNSDMTLNPITDNEIEKTSISVVRDTFEEEIAALKSRKFDNISFKGMKAYSFPDVNKITTYKVKSFEKPSGLSPEQLFENFVAYCDYLEPGKYTREEIAETCYTDGNFRDDPQEQISYNEFIELNKNGDYYLSALYFCDSELYLDYYGNTAPMWYNGGKMKEYLGDESDALTISFEVLDYDKGRYSVEFTENMNSTDVYHLLDGDISIADAAKKANALLAEMAAVGDDGEFQREVYAVNVVDIGDGVFGYVFQITNVVDGIKFAYADARGGLCGGVGYVFSEEGVAGTESFDDLEMVRSDELWSFKTTNAWKERTPIETYDSIVPLSVAAEKASELLSGEMDFKALAVTLVYDIKGDGDELMPCWRFFLENTAKQEQGYHVYVNALTGEARVKCIQRSDYGYEYD